MTGAVPRYSHPYALIYYVFNVMSGATYESGLARFFVHNLTPIQELLE